MPEAFSFDRVNKSFGGVHANRAVSFSVEQGSIHGVVGENGAGKSTILKTLYGLYQPDSGTIRVRGVERCFRSPLEAIEHGVGMVHQHFMLVPTLTVWQNIILGREPRAWGSNRADALKEIGGLQEEFAFPLDLEATVGELALGLQQQVEILKLLYRKADILIFDEPTAVLTPQEVTVLLERMKDLQKRGKTVVFISHKLREILAVTDRVTILRQGEVVGTYPTGELTEVDLAEKMIGRKTRPLPARKFFENPPQVLELRQLGLRKKGSPSLNNVSFSLGAGEILGIAGVDGNGQQELVEVLAKVRQDYEGSVLLQGRCLREQDTYRLKQNGLAVIPPDRHLEGLVLDFSVEENLLLGHQKEFTKQGRIDWKRVNAATKTVIEAYDVRPPQTKLAIRSLSGGNQQKVIIGRELSRKTTLLIAAHPTRGVDIGAIERIHSEILGLRDRGAAVLLVSTELDEILALSDRIAVFYNGSIQGITSRAQATETQLGLWMTGGSA